MRSLVRSGKWSFPDDTPQFRPLTLVKLLKAIRELYAEDAVLHEPHDSAKGHAAISEAVSALLAGMPPDFVFHAAGPAVGHNGVGHLQWRSGPPDGPVAVSGTDVALFEDGLIRSLHVFLDPTGA